MKIGIVVYSQTGNTLSVAEKLKDRLASLGHAAAIERVTAEGQPDDPKSVRFGPLPDLSGYEALALAAPVQAFSLCAAMKAYLPKLPELAGKKVACFTTKSLKSAWTGANKALAAMSKAAGDKGGKVVAMGFVSWKSKSKEQDIEELVAKIAKAFG